MLPDDTVAGPLTYKIAERSTEVVYVMFIAVKDYSNTRPHAYDAFPTNGK